jgi:hypothetical protein
MKWFTDEPKRPDVPEHLYDSARRRMDERSNGRGWSFDPDTQLAVIVEPRLRSEANEFMRQVEQWRAQRDEWEKGQPWSDDPSTYRTRLFDGPWIAGFAGRPGAESYKRLAWIGAPEPILRRFAAEIYELDRMRQVIDAKEQDAAERIRVEAERLKPSTSTPNKIDADRAEAVREFFAALDEPRDLVPSWASGLWEAIQASDESAPAARHSPPSYPIGSEQPYDALLERGLVFDPVTKLGNLGDERWQHLPACNGMRRIS